jgi:hypothetical protein
MARGVLGRTRKWVVLGLALATALAFGGAVLLARTQLVHKSVSQSLSLARLPGTRSSVSATNALASPAASVLHTALFVGASYTQGLGAEPQTNGYAYVVGRQPGWHTVVDGVSGTGFMNPGPHGDQSFLERIGRLPTRPHPDLIVFQGGRNDTSYSQSQLRAAIIATVAVARKRFAGSQIVFLGPIPAYVPVPPNQLAVETTLRAAAIACKVEFIDPIAESWITTENERGYEGAVPAHPDNNGYAYIARRVGQDLDKLLAKTGKY